MACASINDARYSWYEEKNRFAEEDLLGQCQFDDGVRKKCIMCESFGAMDASEETGGGCRFWRHAETDMRDGHKGNGDHRNGRGLTN